MSSQTPFTPRKKPRQARSKATYEAILQATAQILEREGWDAATTNHVARVAGVSIGSLYQYFPNKEALVSELIERHFTRVKQLLVDHLGRAMQSPDAPLEEIVRAFVDAVLAGMAQEPGLHRVFVEQLPRVAGLSGLRERDAFYARVIAAFLEGRRERLRKDVDLDTAIFVLVHAVRGSAIGALFERPEALRDPRFAAELTTLVLRYLGA